MAGYTLCHTATTLFVAWSRYAIYFPESIKGNLVSFVVLRTYFAAALTALQMGLQITP